MTPIPNATSASLGKPLLTFCGILIAGQIMVGLVASFVDLGSNSGPGIAVAMAAAVGAGGVFGNSAKRAMTSGEKVRFAALATVASLLIAAIGVVALFAVYRVPMTLENILLMLGGGADDAAEFQSIMPIIGAVVVLLTMLITYFGVGFGAKSALRQAEKAAAKLGK
jgi:hypothetical protein